MIFYVCVLPVTCATVTSDLVTAISGDTVVIPVRLEENEGIMGFKITVEYPEEVFGNPKVSKGAVTTKGMFNDSIVESTDGEFDVLWNYTADVKESGVLFLMQFDVLQSAAEGEYKIKLTCSQPDTFNENWEDVTLSLSDIVVSIQGYSKPSQTNSQSDEKLESNEGFVEEVIDKVDSEYIQDSIDDALENVGASSIDELDEEKYEEFDNLVSDAVDKYGADIHNKPVDKSGYEVLYGEVFAENFISNVVDYVDSEDVVTIIDNVLTKYVVDKIENVPEESIDKFTDDVIYELKNNGASIGEIPSKIDKLKLIDSLYDEAYKIFISEVKNDNTDLGIKSVIYLAIPVFVLALTICVVSYIKQSKNSKEEK